MKIILGVLSIITGVFFIYIFFDKITKMEERGSWDFKIMSGGIGFVIIGIGVILKELNLI